MLNFIKKAIGLRRVNYNKLTTVKDKIFFKCSNCGEDCRGYYCDEKREPLCIRCLESAGHHDFCKCKECALFWKNVANESIGKERVS